MTGCVFGFACRRRSFTVARDWGVHLWAPVLPEAHETQEEEEEESGTSVPDDGEDPSHIPAQAGGAYPQGSSPGSSDVCWITAPACRFRSLSSLSPEASGLTIRRSSTQRKRRRGGRDVLLELIPTLRKAEDARGKAARPCRMKRRTKDKDGRPRRGLRDSVCRNTL